MADPPSLDVNPESLDQWIQGIRAGGVRQAAPALILVLERWRRAEIPAEQRLMRLRLLKSPVLKTCAGLPKPWSPGRRPGGGSGLGLEQRLYRLMFQNLDQALHALDCSAFGQDPEDLRRRGWLIQNLLRFLRRQLRYAALWGGPLAEGTWRDLYELYAYLCLRPGGAASDSSSADRGAEVLDPELHFKQLLLFGYAAYLGPAAARNGRLIGGLRRWAQESELKDPQVMQGGMDLILVEIAEDAPPRCHRGPLDRAFRGWVLIPSPGFTECIEAALRDTGPPDRPRH